VFLYLPISEGKAIILTILENTSYTDDHNETPEEDQPLREELLIAETPLATFQAVEPEPQPQPSPKEQLVHSLEYPLNIKTDLFCRFWQCLKSTYAKEIYSM